MQKLTSHQQGDRVVIRKIIGSGAFKKRLLEMGFMKNSIVSIIKYAPFQDPMELVIKNYHISLRISEAANVQVEPVGI